MHRAAYLSDVVRSCCATANAQTEVSATLVKRHHKVERFLVRLSALEFGELGFQSSSHPGRKVYQNPPHGTALAFVEITNVFGARFAVQ